MDQGDFIRHRAKPEWGIGQVLRKADDRIDVQFAHGLVPLKLSVASSFIERVSKSEAAAARAASGVNREPVVAAPRPRRAVKRRQAAEPEEAEDE